MLPVISFTLICQDEEEMVGQCIRFMKLVADGVHGSCEFIIVDGGSKDRTMAIINDVKDQRFKVVQNPWPGFAKQLNLSMDLATGEWLFPLAADEVLSDTIFGKINGLIDDKNVIAYSFPKIHLMNDVEHMLDRAGRDPNCRLMRRLKNFRWKEHGGLEKLYFDDKVVVQHPAHFIFPWQRYVPDTVLVHFGELKSGEAKIRRIMKYTKLERSRWYGKTEDEVRKMVERSMSPTGRGPVQSHMACPITKYYKGLRFYSEF